jgi:signal peptidase
MRPFEKMPAMWGRKPLVVLGGSIEPAIKVGSVVLVSHIKPGDIKEGNIITFRTPVKVEQRLRSKQPLSTHRVIKIFNQKKRLYFKTKGDANEDPDNWKISENDILGRATLSLPYLGYLIHFTRGLVGLILLIIVPALLIIAIEIRNILAQLRIVKGTRNV